jgi:hypothetical protein
MIKAGSLFYAIVISLLVAVVSSSLILFAYFSAIQFDNYEMSQRLKQNVDSGINLLLSNQSIVELNQEKTIDLFNNGEDSVYLSRKIWGAYEVIIAKAYFRNESVMKVAQVGFAIDTLDKYSLYLKDEDRPLSVCGKTCVKGTAYLPKAGVKRAYIEGQNFTGNKLIDGAVRQSNKILPEFSVELSKIMDGYIKNEILQKDDSIIQIGGMLDSDSIANSFLLPTLVFNSNEYLKIADGKYLGNIIISSKKQISISQGAILSNVILVAPKIIFEKQFIGNVQAFATDSIIVKEDVRLNYPSCLGIIKSDSPIPVSAIVLSEKDSVFGNVFAYKKSIDPMKQVAVVLKKGAFVYGQLYSSGNADIQGVIFGSLMCSKIMLTTPSSVYENHLLNATINSSRLSNHFVGNSLVGESEHKNIAKWLESR